MFLIEVKGLPKMPAQKLHELDIDFKKVLLNCNGSLESFSKCAVLTHCSKDMHNVQGDNIVIIVSGLPLVPHTPEARHSLQKLAGSLGFEVMKLYPLALVECRLLPHNPDEVVYSSRSR